MHGTPKGTQEATRGILRSLFPPWLPPAFAVMFAKPLPGISCQVRVQRLASQPG
jgi:predicted AlkP superfamily phosphohydrolase/phosphomutase